jgi:hypothetical protein
VAVFNESPEVVCRRPPIDSKPLVNLPARQKKLAIFVGRKSLAQFEYRNTLNAFGSPAPEDSRPGAIPLPDLAEVSPVELPGLRLDRLVRKAPPGQNGTLVMFGIGNRPVEAEQIPDETQESLMAFTWLAGL